MDRFSYVSRCLSRRLTTLLLVVFDGFHSAALSVSKIAKDCAFDGRSRAGGNLVVQTKRVGYLADHGGASRHKFLVNSDQLTAIPI